MSLKWNVDGNTGPIPLREVFIKDLQPNPLPAIDASLPPSEGIYWETLPHGSFRYSQRAILAHAESLAAALKLRKEDRVLQNLHLSTVSAVSATLATWLQGGALLSCGPEPRDPLLTLKALNTEHASVFIAPEEHFEALLEHPALAKHPFPPLRLVALVCPLGKSPAPALLERIAATFKATEYVLASSAAESGIVFTRPLLGQDATHLGALLPGAEAALHNGHLRVRTPLALDRKLLRAGADAAAGDEWTSTNIRAAQRDGSYAIQV